MIAENNLVLKNGIFHTLDARRPLAPAAAIRGNQILFIGSNEEAEAIFAGEVYTAVNLKQAAVIPGLTDAHVHFEWYSTGLQAIDAETPTLEEVLGKVEERTRSIPQGKWITGYGWNHNVWGENFPSAGQLDRVSPHHPVALVAKSAHASWVNSAALRLAGITDTTPNPPGGQIVRDPAGKATGLLLEEAMRLVDRIIPSPTPEELVEMVRQGMENANRLGLTGIHDMDQPSVFRAFQSLQRTGQLTLRVNKSIPLAYLEQAIAAGFQTGFGNDLLHIGPVKMFADGALGPKTAWMLSGYDSSPEDRGISTTDIEVIYESVLKANTNGLATAIHAIGDRANREILNIYAEVKRTQPFTGMRNRIEHVQLLSLEDSGRLAELGVIASMQPIHATSDMDIAEKHWGSRLAGAYAWKTQLEKGAVLAFGSDCPVETMNPLAGIHAAVTRRRADGSPGPDGWRSEQRLTVEEAVRGYTIGPAYAAGMEDRLGILAPGYLADMTILDRDIFTIDPMEILNTRVLGTIVDGKFAWRDASL
ncbi:MAG: amidohydrolase [Leptolinea sp.]|jgi:predicted amidohydrolase YtcJ|nr:amidohydrolase [Leptolinea sp.]